MISHEIHSRREKGIEAPEKPKVPQHPDAEPQVGGNPGPARRRGLDIEWIPGTQTPVRIPVPERKREKEYA